MFLKVKGFHYTNAPSFFDKFLMILKPFLNQQTLDMLHIHTVRDGLKGLEKILPIAALPKDVGGEYKTTEECQSKFFNRFFSYSVNQSLTDLQKYYWIIYIVFCYYTSLA